MMEQRYGPYFRLGGRPSDTIQLCAAIISWNRPAGQPYVLNHPWGDPFEPGDLKHVSLAAIHEHKLHTTPHRDIEQNVMLLRRTYKDEITPPGVCLLPCTPHCVSKGGRQHHKKDGMHWKTGSFLLIFPRKQMRLQLHAVSENRRSCIFVHLSSGVSVTHL